MSFIPTAGAVRTDMQFSCAGQQVHNIFWFSRDAAWTQAEREALNTALAAWWNVSGKQNFASAIALTQITTVNQDANNAPSSTLIVSPAVAGTNVAAAAANNVSLCTTLRTALRGRSYRGRTYFGGISSLSVQDAITFTTQTLTNFVTMMTALQTAVTALGAVWVVVSKWINKVPRAQGLKTPITAISADQYIDSQRRRLGLRGV